MKGSCHCGNIEITWFWENPERIHPVICDCDFCTSRRAQYVFRSGTALQIRIKNPSNHSRMKQGTGTAVFHECLGCQMLIGVTVESGGKIYGAINRSCFARETVFGDPVTVQNDNAPIETRIHRWERYWCNPVEFCR